MKFKAGDIVKYTGLSGILFTYNKHYKVIDVPKIPGTIDVIDNCNHPTLFPSIYFELVSPQMTLDVFDGVKVLSAHNINKCECGSHKLGNTEPGPCHSHWCVLYRKC